MARLLLRQWFSFDRLKETLDASYYNLLLWKQSTYTYVGLAYRIISSWQIGPAEDSRLINRYFVAGNALLSFNSQEDFVILGSIVKKKKNIIIVIFQVIIELNIISDSVMFDMFYN